MNTSILQEKPQNTDVFEEKERQTEIYWCGACQTPIVNYTDDADKGFCPLCNGKTKYFVVDIRPVFPEERLLLEILIDKPLAFIDKTVWYNENLIQPAINHIYSIEEKVYVSRDRAILRENANSRSDGIITVLYGDELKVIESVPRWVKVAYQDENGVIYIGFVSKISVEELTNE